MPGVLARNNVDPAGVIFDPRKRGPRSSSLYSFLPACSLARSLACSLARPPACLPACLGYTRPPVRLSTFSPLSFARTPSSKTKLHYRTATSETLPCSGGRRERVRVNVYWTDTLCVSAHRVDSARGDSDDNNSQRDNQPTRSRNSSGRRRGDGKARRFPKCASSRPLSPKI